MALTACFAVIQDPVMLIPHILLTSAAELSSQGLTGDRIPAFRTAASTRPYRLKAACSERRRSWNKVLKLLHRKAKGRTLNTASTAGSSVTSASTNSTLSA